MNLKEFQIKARQTALFPETSLARFIHGLVAAIGKATYGYVNGQKTIAESYEAMWCSMNILWELGFVAEDYSIIMVESSEDAIRKLLIELGVICQLLNDNYHHPDRLAMKNVVVRIICTLRAFWFFQGITEGEVLCAK